MRYAAYRLNPGDMFQVDPERVLVATGKTKPNLAKVRETRAKIAAKYGSSSIYGPSGYLKEEAGGGAAEAATEESAQEGPAETAAAPGGETTLPSEQDPDAPETPAADLKPTRKAIQSLTEQARAILADTTSAKQKQRLRAFIAQSRRLVSRTGRADATTRDITDELARMVSDMQLSADGDASASVAAPQSDGGKFDDVARDLDRDERRRLAHLMAEYEENPEDPTKPYATPWRPRPFMSAFAYIPRYLEVNQNICSAVYLRHPVARAGSAEVPTPFDRATSQLAFNYYLKRR